MQKLLITGTSGMVGRNVKEHPAAQGYELLTPTHAELDLLDKNAVADYIKAHKPDAVVHCAGLVGGIVANMQNLAKFLTHNAYMGLNLINACAQGGVGCFLNLASSCMYPKNAPNPLREDMILQGAFEPTNEGYALAKVLSTRLCEYISAGGGLYKTAIPCNLYGKYDKFDTARAHMMPAVIARVHKAKAQGVREVAIWGDGTARREFMYAGDLADFVFYALQNLEKMPQNLNVGTGKDYTIRHYYETIAKVLGYDVKFTSDASKPKGMAQKLIDDTQLKNFGWSVKTTLEKGIKETYEYYLTQPEFVRGGGSSYSHLYDFTPNSSIADTANNLTSAKFGSPLGISEVA